MLYMKMMLYIITKMNAFINILFLTIKFGFVKIYLDLH